MLLMCDHAIPAADRHAGDLAVVLYLSLFRQKGWRTAYCPLRPDDDTSDRKRLEARDVVTLASPEALRVWLARYGSSVTATWLARPEVADAILPMVRASTTGPVVYFTHDLHFLRLQREAAVTGDESLSSRAVAMKSLEQSIFRAVDGILTPSGYEVETIRPLAPDVPVSAIPLHFFDERELNPRDATHFGSRSDLLFVGGFPHRPNVDAAMFLVEQVMPLVWQRRPDTRLFLVGHSPPECVTRLAGDRVVVTGFVPDVGPYYDRARAVVVGLRYGAGVKGKVLEAFRHGVPVVATETSTEGIAATPDQDLFVGNSPAELALKAIELLENPLRCEALSEAGTELLRRHYTADAAWHTIAGMVHRAR
jgi:glycosyltransferase involved in cell wall biosynthesis